MHQLRDILGHDKALADRMDCVIKDKGANDKQRFSKLLDHHVDTATIEFLDENHKDWLTDPRLFFDRITLSQFISVDTRAQVMREHHLEAEQDII
jgi:hypothetical protein